MLLVTLRAMPGDPSWAADARTVSEEPRVLAIDDPPQRVVEMVALGIEEGLVLSAVLVDEPLRDRLWIAYEWHRRFLVVDSSERAARWLRNLGWSVAGAYENFLIFSGPTVEEPSPAVEFERTLHQGDAAPVVVELGVDARTEEREDIFGDLVPSRFGGSSALLALSGARPNSSQVRLGNLAALELDMVAREDTISARTASGEISYRAIGLVYDSEVPANTGFVDAIATHEVWAARSESHLAYWVLLELVAVVDPVVWIPVGQVFEQRGVTGIQTLATAPQVEVVVTPGRTTTLALPAWCLNSSLAPPRGEPLGATPLRVRYDTDASQGNVWSDRERILRALK